MQLWHCFLELPIGRKAVDNDSNLFQLIQFFLQVIIASFCTGWSLDCPNKPTSTQEQLHEKLQWICWRRSQEMLQAEWWAFTYSQIVWVLIVAVTRCGPIPLKPIFYQFWAFVPGINRCSSSCIRSGQATSLMTLQTRFEGNIVKV